MTTADKKRIYLLVLSLALGLVSCTNWVQVLETHSYEVVYDGNANIVLLFESTEHNIYRKALEIDDGSIRITDIQEIQTPNDSLVKSLCAFNGIWISTIATPLGSSPTLLFNTPEASRSNIIYYYSDTSKDWTQIESADGFTKCKVFNNKNVVFWSAKEIFVFDEKISKKFYNMNWDIEDIASDKDGNLWVATSRGEIYKQSKNGWEFIDILATDSKISIFIDKNGNLWVASNDRYIYRYTPINFIKEKVFESDLGWRQLFFEDKNGELWLSTNNNLFVQSRDGFYKFQLPFSTDVVTSIFITNNNFLMVDNENGLFYFDLESQQ